jgi:hypothetical protein
MARDMKNEIENAPRRRRRSGANSTSQPKPTSQQEPPPPMREPIILDSLQHHSLSPDNRISLEVPLGLADNAPPVTEGGTPISNYSRSYSPCACHGAPQCPSLLGIGTGPPDPRKPVSIVGPPTDQLLRHGFNIS